MAELITKAIIRKPAMSMPKASAPISVADIARRVFPKLPRTRTAAIVTTRIALPAVNTRNCVSVLSAVFQIEALGTRIPWAPSVRLDHCRITMITMN